MIARPLILVIICFGFFILLQSLLPKVMALKGSAKLNGFLLENQRTRKRKNYVLRMDRDNDIIRSESPCTNYENVMQSDTNPIELPAFITDYANMIRDDVILLDTSVETRTHKRGEVKEDNQAIPDPPCNCKYNKTTKDFGVNYFPRYVEIRHCSEDQQACRPPYICKENLYELINIRRRDRLVNPSEYPHNLPFELKYKWFAEKHNISVGCVCTRDYIIEN